MLGGVIMTTIIILQESAMPMIDVYAVAGTFANKHALSTAAGDANYVRVQVLTPVGTLDRDKQLGVVRELTDIVAAAAGDPTLTDRTWVLITESPEGGWGINGPANTGQDIVAAARAALAAGGDGSSYDTHT